MKKRFSLMLVLCLLAVLLVPAAAAPLPGDVNGDGSVGADDARLALRRSVDLEHYPMGSDAFLAADFDGDGTVSAMDARSILRVSVNLPVSETTPASVLRTWYFAQWDRDTSEYALCDPDGDGKQELLVLSWEKSPTEMFTLVTLTLCREVSGKAEVADAFVLSNTNFHSIFLDPQTQLLGAAGREAVEVFTDGAGALALQVYTRGGAWRADYMKLSIENGRFILQNHLLDPGTGDGEALYTFENYFSAAPQPLYRKDAAGVGGRYPSCTAALEAELAGFSYRAEAAYGGKCTVSPAEKTEKLFAVTNYGGAPELSKTEIVERLQAAVNRTKAYAGEVMVKHTENISLQIDRLQPAGALKTLANTLMAAVMKPTDETLVFSGGRAENSEGETVPLLLPKRQNFSLPADGVESAVLTEKDGVTEITLTLIPETSGLGEQPEYNAGAIGYLSSEGMDLSMITITELFVSYPGSQIKAKINADGYVTEAEYTVPVRLEGKGSALFVNGELETHGTEYERWTILW